MNTGDQAVRAVERLHGAIEGWYRGTIPQDGFDTEIADLLADGFRMVAPLGREVGRVGILRGLKAAYRSNPNIHIFIEDTETVTEFGPFAVVSYVERQTGARRTAQRNARRSTALVEVTDRARLLHLQETWIA